ELEPHAERVVLEARRRERDEPAVVIAFVGKCNQMLVLATIMPAQHLARHARAEARIENALELRRFLLLGWVVDGWMEKSGRRQLLVIGGDDQLLAAIDRADGVLRQKFGRPIENDQVKLQLARLSRQKLAHRQRAHQYARLELQQKRRDAVEQ